MKDQDRFWDLNNVYRYRNDNLAALGFQSYRAYLRSDLWQSIKARVFQERGRRCERCERPASHVHHRAYDPATLRGDDIRSLTVACRRCHGKAEKPEMRQSAQDRLMGANKYLFRRHSVPKGHAIWRQKRKEGRERRRAIEQFEKSWADDLSGKVSA